MDALRYLEVFIVHKNVNCNEIMLFANLFKVIFFPYC